MLDDGDVRCGACEKKLDLIGDVFLCRACIDKLPDSIRKAVMTNEEPYQYAARKAALEHLGVLSWKIDKKHINIKPAKERSVKACRCKKPLLMKTDGLFGGTEMVCGNCCCRVENGARRVMA